jgi:uncharacterized protein
LNPDDLDLALALDDSVISGALWMMAGARDPLITEFAKRIRERKLYKCTDVRESLNRQLRKKEPRKSVPTKNPKRSS